MIARGLPQKIFIALLVAAVLGAGILALGVRVVRIEGRSMEPALRPGDRALVLTLPGYVHLVDEGDLVLASPAPGQDPGGIVIKRVSAIERGGSHPFYRLAGDNPERSRDSRDYGLVSRERIRGLVVWVF